MSSDGPGPERLPEAIVRPPRAAFSSFELWIVTFLCLAFLLPGIWGYSLVDPWETHYGEVARRMLRDHDWIHTDWQHEGFRSKPVLTFWLTAASMKLFGVAGNGGYSGEMVKSPWVLFVVRFPFVMVATAALVSVWMMLARLVSRRVAYLALIAIASSPFFCLVARQEITDMPLCACLMGAMAMFAMATEAGDAPLRRLGRIGRFSIDGRHLFFLVIGGFIAAQGLYDFLYFLGAFGPKAFAIRFAAWMPHPAILFLVVFAAGLVLMHHRIGPFITLLVPPILIGLAVSQQRRFAVVLIAVVGVGGFAYAAYQFASPVVQKLWRMLPLTTDRQIYMLWFWGLLGISILAKGPPAVAVAGIACAFYVILLHRWRDLLDGKYEIKRGLVLLLVTSVPWHIAMWMRDGNAFINEYIQTHLLSRASVAELGSKGTFEYYLPQIGYGMFVWAALLPAALAAVVLRTSARSREDRVRLIIGLWAIGAVAFFSIIQTKFHHYILPAIPAFAILVAFWMDDVLAGRIRVSPVYAVCAAVIVLLITRDLMHEEKNWIEMLVFRYDRPWPTGEPWLVDTSDGFLGLGLASAAAVLLFAIPRLRVLAVAATCVAGLATGLWAMHVYMPIAGTHWGQREAIRHYYEDREIYGMRLVYYDVADLVDAWKGRTTYRMRTLVPEHVYVGQPMTFRISLRDPDDKSTVGELKLPGVVQALDDSSIEVAFDPKDVAPVIEIAARAKDRRHSGRHPIEVVDADRLISWQLYWRGEVFWSGDEIWGPLPDQRSDWQLETNTAGINKLLADPTACPPGRRYFVITEAGRVTSLRAILPTQHADGTPSPARDTFEVLDTTSNKFSLAAFWL
jgi:4-amino-4-deoxy-L-arabinose transferase-like glycosyltransferase